MNIKIYTYMVIVAIALVGCTQDIDIKLGKVAPELVVDGFINTDTTTHTICLSKSAYYFANKPAEAVSSAIVTLSDGTSTITLMEDAAKKGAYHTPSGYYGVVGRTYTLTITNVDVNGDGVKEEYTATSTIPTRFVIDKIDVLKKNEFKKDFWMVSVWMQDPPVERNFYLIKLYKNDVCITDSIQEWGTASDGIFNGYKLEEQQMVRFSSDKADEVVHNGDRITLEISDVPEDYMYFVNDAASEFWGSTPLFGGQPSNIRTNIRLTAPSGGTQKAHGYFAAYATTRKNTVYEE